MNARDGRYTAVVGYDGSDNSKVALSYAAERAGTEGKLVVVNAYAPSPHWFGAPSFQPVLDDYKSQGESLLSSLDRELPQGVECETKLVEGPPPEALVATAKECEADEIIVGTRGFYPLRSGLGSVANTLLQVADRPVVVVPLESEARYRAAGDASGQPGDAPSGHSG